MARALKGMVTVSTHSRPEAAGFFNGYSHLHNWVSTHSRPEAAGPATQEPVNLFRVSTHSRPEAAGHIIANKYV